MILISLNEQLTQLERSIPNFTSTSLEWIQLRAAEIMKESLSTTFNEGSSGKWKGLAASTQRNRAWAAKKFGLAIGPSAPILKRFGQLRAAILGLRPVSTVGPEFVQASWGEQSIRKSGIGANKAAYGGTVFEKYIYNQSKRPMVLFRDVDTSKLQSSYSSWIATKINAMM